MIDHFGTNEACAGDDRGYASAEMGAIEYWIVFAPGLYVDRFIAAQSNLILEDEALLLFRHLNHRKRNDNFAIGGKLRQLNVVLPPFKTRLSSINGAA